MTNTKIALLIGIPLIAIMGFRTVRDTGMLLSLEPISAGQCERINGPIGAEDMSIDQVNKIAYIAADDRRAYLQHGNMENIENGKLWTLDLSDPNSKPQVLTLDIDGIFHPHGMALRSDEDGAKELYVVNHLSTTQHEIDVFTIPVPGKLHFKRRITYPELISPNDLVVVAEDQFFVSNDHGNPRHTVWEVLEDYLGLPLSSVTYFDGQKGHLVIEGLRMANGVALSADQQSLYVAESMGRSIKRYSAGDSMLDWTLEDSLYVDSIVDNLEWDEQGRLLTGAHPKGFDFLAHSKDAKALSPSEIIRIDVRQKDMTHETLHLDMGEGISGSSVAAINGQTLLIGPVFEPHFMRCKMAATPKT